MAAAPSGVASEPRVLMKHHAEGEAAVPAAVPEGGGHAGLEQPLRPGVEHGGTGGLVKGSAAAATAMAAAAGGQVKKTSRLALRRAGATAAEGSDNGLGDVAQAKRAKQG